VKADVRIAATKRDVRPKRSWAVAVIFRQNGSVVAATRKRVAVAAKTVAEAAARNKSSQ